VKVPPVPDAVWKYTLDYALSEIGLPSGATVLTVALQRNKICLWARVDPRAEKVTLRTFRVVGTGHEVLTGDETYLGSAHSNDGNFVFHVFELNGSR